MASMDAKDRRIAELETLLQAALEENIQIQSEIATLKNTPATLPNHPPPTSSNRPNNAKIKASDEKSTHKKDIGASAEAYLIFDGILTSQTSDELDFGGGIGSGIVCGEEEEKRSLALYPMLLNEQKSTTRERERVEFFTHPYCMVDGVCLQSVEYVL